MDRLTASQFRGGLYVAFAAFVVVGIGGVFGVWWALITVGLLGTLVLLLDAYLRVVERGDGA